MKTRQVEMKRLLLSLQLCGLAQQNISDIKGKGGAPATTISLVRMSGCLVPAFIFMVPSVEVG